ncbi:MAG: Stk1 family PASTA domain-containing Ser/Thr kinase [Clostridia bacterium]|nr:Stk1 family PASTA domain-containing Ser/Thr kinase [Clostridia bacterium]
MDKYVGKRLDGRYEIQSIIGIGGMAVVYKAYDNIENRIVAIKILKDEFVSNEEFIRRFKNESKAIAMLSHQNIVKVYDVSFGDLIQYIVMEYIDGITLKEFIEEKGSLRYQDAVYFTIQILKALQHAHDKGIVHRDVKPQNIMVLEDGSIKVTDFGIARFSRSEQRTITDKAIGSVHYISPEQAKGEKTDEKTDIYSVGVMLYEMLTGRLPFEAERAVSVAIMQLQTNPKLPTEINSSIPLGLEQITMHAMQKLTERRYQSAAEMLCDLDRFRKDPEATFGYSYFVDNSPTKFVATPTPSVKDDDYYIDSDKKPKKDKDNGNKSSTVPILAGIAAALIIALAVGGFFIIRSFSSKNNKKNEVEVPNFIGMTRSEIENNSRYKKDFEFIFEEKNNDDVANGEVFDQDIDAGNNVKKKSTIVLTVSTGTKKVKVPKIYDVPEEDAITILKNRGLKVGEIIREANEDYEKGNVFKTEPPVNQTVEKGSKVTLYISEGSVTKLVEVPDITGLKEADAESKLTKEGLVPKKVTRALTPSDKEYIRKGIVISQSIKESQKADTPEGTVVTFYVSDGTVKTDLTIDYNGEYTATKPIKFVIWVNGQKLTESTEYKNDYIGKVTFKNVILESDSVDATVSVSEEDGEEMDIYNITITPFGKNTVTVY